MIQISSGRWFFPMYSWRRKETMGGFDEKIPSQYACPSTIAAGNRFGIAADASSESALISFFTDENTLKSPLSTSTAPTSSTGLSGLISGGAALKSMCLRMSVLRLVNSGRPISTDAIHEENKNAGDEGLDAKLGKRPCSTIRTSPMESLSKRISDGVRAERSFHNPTIWSSIGAGSPWA